MFGDLVSLPPQGAVIPLGDPLDPTAVAGEIDREIRALPAQRVQPVRAVRRAWSRRLRPAPAEAVVVPLNLPRGARDPGQAGGPQQAGDRPQAPRPARDLTRDRVSRPTSASTPTRS
jgi:hypothetical protein